MDGGDQGEAGGDPQLQRRAHGPTPSRMACGWGLGRVARLWEAVTAKTGDSLFGCVRGRSRPGLHTGEHGCQKQG